MSAAEWALAIAVALAMGEVAQRMEWRSRLWQMRAGQHTLLRAVRHAGAGDDRRQRALLAGSRRLGFASLALLIAMLLVLSPLLPLVALEALGWLRADLLSVMLSGARLPWLSLVTVLPLALRRGLAGR